MRLGEEVGAGSGWRLPRVGPSTRGTLVDRLRGTGRPQAVRAGTRMLGTSSETSLDGRTASRKLHRLAHCEERKRDGPRRANGKGHPKTLPALARKHSLAPAAALQQTDPEKTGRRSSAEIHVNFLNSTYKFKY